MAFIPVHQSLPGHKLMIRLRMATGLPVPHLAGHLVCLWLWAIDNARDGVLPAEPAIVAEASRWEGDPDHWLDALLTSGFVVLEADGSLAIHDWADYVGNYFDALERYRAGNRERQARFRERHKGETDRNVTNNVTRNGPKRYVTLRNVLREDQIREDQISGGDRARAREAGAGASPPPAPPPPRPPESGPIPADFALTAEMRAWAAEYAPDADAETETRKFVARARDTGKRSADWLGAWQSWMLSPYAVRDTQARAGPGGNGARPASGLTDKTERTLAVFANFDPTRRKQP